MAVERVLSNLNLISFKTEGGLQNHIDELQDGDLVFTPDSSLKGNLFDFKWTDHKLNDISWLNADTFSWQSGDVYEAAYNHLAEDCKVYAWQYAPTQGGDIGYTTTETPAVGGVLMIGGNACNITEVGSDYVVAEHYKTGEVRTYQRVADSDSTAFVAGVLSTDTVDDITVTFYRAEDGHKICLADQEANVQRLYDWMGVAWYYVLDTANKQFKLPRTKFGFTGLRDTVGGYVKAGLPNIEGTILSRSLSSDYPGAITHGTGAFSFSKKTGANSSQITLTTTSGAADTISFDASSSSSVYGNSNTVQPEATQMYLYFYVGNFEREAIEQTAGINAEMFNDKADVNLNNTDIQERLDVKANTNLDNIPSNYDYVVASQNPTSANGYTWFRKYKSGWVEQGGRQSGNLTATYGESTSFGTITLPVPMSNGNSYYAGAIGNGYTFLMNVHPTTTTIKFDFGAYTTNRTLTQVRWFVSGYAA